MIKNHLIIFSICFFAVELFGHARLMPSGTLVPRNSSAGLKTAPCGGVAKSVSPTVLEKGKLIQVQWEETVNHPGRFEFYFSQSGEQNFVLLKTVEDTQNRNDDLPHRYTTSLQLPDVECTDCVIQMIQVMTENPDFPRNYYSCADIELRADANVPANPSPTPSPTEAPGPHTCE